MKLIRDKTPGLLNMPGVTRPVRDRDEHLMLLRMKLMEEAAEVAASTSVEEMIEEMGDLNEVWAALMKLMGIMPVQVMEASIKKKEIKGGFVEGVVLVYDPMSNKTT